MWYYYSQRLKPDVERKFQEMEKTRVRSDNPP